MSATMKWAIAFALIIAAAGLAFAGLSRVTSQSSAPPAAVAPQGEWATDSIWYDGLVEKAVYDAEKVIYGHPRSYEALFLTNKEQHDTQTWTKADGSDRTVEVWKHNIIEVVPTPNYDYKFESTSHFETDNLALTRLDVASQEWCGTSFKQYMREGDGTGGTPAWSFFQFSYMPEAGRVNATVQQEDRPVVPFNGLSLFLRGYDFVKRPDLELMLLPDQKANGLTPHEPVEAFVRFAGENDEGYRLDLFRGPITGEKVGGPIRVGSFTFAKDRNHVMLSYEGVNGDSYTLTGLDRIDYWTRDE